MVHFTTHMICIAAYALATTKSRTAAATTMALIAARQMMSAASVPLVTVVVDCHILSVHRLQGTTTVFGGGREQTGLLFRSANSTGLCSKVSREHVW